MEIGGEEELNGWSLKSLECAGQFAVWKAGSRRGILIRQSPLFPGSNLTHISRFTKAHKMLPAC